MFEAFFVIVTFLVVLGSILWWSGKFLEPDLNEDTINAEKNVIRSKS